ncbi:hypothetical protein [Roseibium sp. MB-4]
MMPLIKSYRAHALVSGMRLVAASATDREVMTATDPTDPILGVADTFDIETGEMVDVILSGPAPVVSGGDIDFGDPITAGPDGRAVKAVPVAGSIVRFAGFALSDAAENDQFDMVVAPGILNTPA